MSLCLGGKYIFDPKYQNISGQDVLCDGMIVPLTHHSLPGHLKVLMDIDKDTLGEVWTEGHFRHDLPMKWDLSMLMIENGVMKGFLIASNKNGKAHIHRLVIDKDSRNHGLGKILINALKEKTRQHNLGGITLKVASQNKEAIRFYEQIGFQRLGSERGNYLMTQSFIA